MKVKLLALLSALPLGLLADVTLPGMFSDHAVLARLKKTPIFGKAAAGEAVTVEFAGLKASATADSKGKWKVCFNLMKTPAGPHILTVKGKNTLKRSDILVGQVWLCSGQSNMQFQLKNAQGAAEIIKNSTNKNLRLYTVPCRASVKPEETLKSVWRLAEPASVPAFTAIGYLFGAKLQKELNTPVGLINASWGGSAVEAWATMDYLKGNKELEAWCKTTYEKYTQYDEELKKYLEKFDAWKKACNLKEPTENTPPADVKWQENVQLRGFNKVGPGVIWYKKKIEVPESIEQKGGIYNFYQHCANAVFYIDGKVVAKTTPQGEVNGGYVAARFKLGELKAGSHELVIRYWSLYDEFKTLRLSYTLPGNISLMQGWQRTIQPIKLTKEQIASRPARLQTPPERNKTPELLYNGMIYALKPYGINGCIWYQGCTNAGRPQQYPAAIQGMIREWRRDFGWEFPFYYCSLANYRSKTADPNDAGWAEIRRGQEGALALPQTAQAILIDCGESGDIHPIDKETPANRLAAIALAKMYGKKVPFSGPVFKEKVIEGNKIRIRFDHVEGGLEAKALPAKYPQQKVKNRWADLVRNSPSSQLEGFALAGADGKYFWAEAKIENDTVVVSSPKVPVPQKVRYGFQSNPTCNLYNKAVFPAVPFER